MQTPSIIISSILLLANSVTAQVYTNSSSNTSTTCFASTITETFIETLIGTETETVTVTVTSTEAPLFPAIVTPPPAAVSSCAGLGEICDLLFGITCCDELICDNVCL